MENFKNWMTEAANIMFDDTKNDLRSLPKSVRLQILIVLSFFLSLFLLKALMFLQGLIVTKPHTLVLKRLLKKESKDL